MKAFKLTLRNSFKNAFQSMTQVFGLIVLITILSLIVSLITSIYAGVINNFNNLVKVNNSNLRTIVLDMNTDSRVKTGSDPTADGDIPRNNVEAQQMYLYKLNQKYLVENPEWSFSWSRTEERNFSGLSNQEYNLRVKTIAKTTPNVSEYSVDRLVIGTGHDILNPKQTVIDATFARKNNLKIGDVVRYQPDVLGTQLKVVDSELASISDLNRLKEIKDLNDPNDIYNQFYSTFSWFQIVGFGESADFVAPTMSAGDVLPNKNTELIAYVHPEVFGLMPSKNRLGFVSFDESRMVLAVSSSADRDGYYSLKLKGDKKGYGKGLDLQTIAKTFNDDFNKIMNRSTSSGSQLFYGVNNHDYKYYGRIWNLVAVINIYNIIAGSLLLLVLGVVLFTIGLVTKKQVEKTRSQIGLMKALGYRKRMMLFNYSVLPLITSVIGSIIGFSIAQGLQIVIINNVFAAYFNLNFPIWTFDTIGFILLIFGIWVIITAIAFLIAWLIMRDDTLDLISGNKDPKISKLGMFIKQLSFGKKIMPKLRSSLLATSLGKMSAVSLVVLLATMLILEGFAAPKVLNDNQKMSYKGINYQQLIEYDSPTYNNPYTFMQTYDPTNHENSYKFNPGLNKITALPTKQVANSSTDEPTYEYDMVEIINQLLTQRISSEYYSLEVRSETEIPNPFLVLFANQKMLNARGVALNNHFFKMIADWAQVDEIGWNILNNQWPAYIDLIDNLQQQQLSLDQNKQTYNQTLINDFYFMQNFYRTYMASVGLTIGATYYLDVLNPDNTPDAKIAYENHDYSKQISLFNDNVEGRKAAFQSYKKEYKNDQEAFGKLLNGLTLSDETRISDGTNSLAINSLYRKNDNEQELDKYLVYNPETILNEQGVEALESYLADYLFWYSSFLSQRSGTAIIQAAYSRPPYFVQQMFKEAYLANDKDKSYNFSFGLVPFNPLKEQLGLMLNANQHNNRDLEFKIYGIENNKKFVDLRDKNNLDLNQVLFTSNDANSIVINQTIAKKLNLTTGDLVKFDVLYNELQNNNQAYKVSDWKANATRLVDEDLEDDGYFIARNDLDVFETTIDNPVGAKQKSYKISAGNMNLDNRPSEYYQAILEGEIQQAKKTKSPTFKVVGVHDGYGTMQAWMKNSDVKNILNYQDSQEYLWTNFFAPQFGREFSKRDVYNNILDMYFVDDLRAYSYQSFLDNFVNNDQSTFNVAANKINLLFNNTYPIFNYKYTLNDDIADLKSGVATAQSFGDYSLIAMNGGISNGVNYDGMGVSAIKTLTPIKISQDVLSELSLVIQSVLILLIVMLIVITFIIILLTTSLIINDNVRFIATMKVLGYSNKNIASVILGMYGIVISITFVLGYIGGWFLFVEIINLMAMKTALVLPLSYPVWLVFAVGIVILGIYAVSFLIGYRSVVKQNATHVLQNQEI